MLMEWGQFSPMQFWCFLSIDLDMEVETLTLPIL